MKKIFLILAIGLFSGLICSCATVMRENTQAVPFKSNVDKVNIKIMNRAGEVVFEGQTPTTITLKTSASGYFAPEKLMKN